MHNELLPAGSDVERSCSGSEKSQSAPGATVVEPISTASRLPDRFMQCKQSPGNIFAVALHDGHAISSDLLPYLLADEAMRRRDEDPLTGMLAGAGDSSIIARRSRFEVDLNRTEEGCLSIDPQQTWGLRFWRESPPASLWARSRNWHRLFYQRVHELLTALLEEWGTVLVLDIHSYNHQRDGEGKKADQQRNPDIDIGITEAEWSRWGPMVDKFAAALARTPVRGRHPDVRYNVRYPDGGNFPEWVDANFDDRVCTLTLEYKKFYMNEWSDMIYMDILDDLRAGLEHAIEQIRSEIERG